MSRKKKVCKKEITSSGNHRKSHAGPAHPKKNASKWPNAEKEKQTKHPRGTHVFVYLLKDVDQENHGKGSNYFHVKC